MKARLKNQPRSVKRTSLHLKTGLVYLIPYINVLSTLDDI